MSTYWLILVCCAGFALTMWLTRETLEIIEAHLNYRRREGYRQLEEQLIHARGEAMLWKDMYTDIRGEQMQNLLHIRRLTQQVSHMEFDLSADEVPMFLRRQAS